MRSKLRWLITVAAGAVLFGACSQPEPNAIEPGEEQVEAALAPSSCPAAPEVELDESDYAGPLIDSHFHIPHIPDSFNGTTPVLGENITVSEIACTLEREGTAKAFAFFPVYPEIDWQYPLEVANRTMQEYPDRFVPFSSCHQDLTTCHRRRMRMI